MDRRQLVPRVGTGGAGVEDGTFDPHFAEFVGGFGDGLSLPQHRRRLVALEQVLEVVLSVGLGIDVGLEMNAGNHHVVTARKVLIYGVGADDENVRSAGHGCGDPLVEGD